MNALGRDLLDLLFASLWQGACIGVTVVAVLALTGSRLNAATRYIVLLGALPCHRDRSAGDDAA